MTDPFPSEELDTAFLNSWTVNGESDSLVSSSRLVEIAEESE